MKKRPIDMVLSERERLILNCVVEAYVQTAIPVGSKFLARKFGLEISPATIRNVMNDLEERGFLCHPHVSAGRIPTDLGYRSYVDGLMSLRRLKKRERDLIEDNLNMYTADVREILHAASGVLSRISSQLGVVLEPRFFEGIFQRMELVSISENRIMAVISIKSGLVRTIMMEMESEVSQDQLHGTSYLINERLSGLSLKEVKETIDKRLAGVTVSNNRLLKLILESSDRLFNFQNYEGLYLGGTVNIVSNPEFSDRRDIAKILDLLENKAGILNKFSQNDGAGLSVSIGRENEEASLRSCSVISAKYLVGTVSGMLGVVGPTRMEYARIIPLVDYVGVTLTRLFADRS